MTRTRVAGVILTVLLSPGVRGDEPRIPIPLPLVVTDGRGRSIPDLAAADLEITENGKARSISSVQFHGPAPRQLVILLDQYHVTPGAHTERARASLTAFIDRYVRPGDTVSVVRPPAHYETGAADLASARAAVQQFNGRKGEYTPQGPFEAEYMGSAPPFASRQRAQIVRAALESVASAMRSAEGAKALIVVTEGFEQGEPSSRSRTTTLRAIGRAARVSNIPVYILDPSESRPEASPLNDAWRAITVQTGGMLFEAGSSPDASFARIAADLGARYVVQFDPSAGEDGGFHGIEVRVKRKGAIVRAPTGYWAPFAASRFAPPSPNRGAYLRTPHASGLIQPWLRMAPAPSGRTRVTFAWAPRPAGARAARVSLEAITFEGEKLQSSSLPALRSSTPDDPAEVTFDAAPGEPIQLSLGIHTSKDTLLDTDVHYFNVPRFAPGQPVIAAIEFVRPRSLPEFTAMKTDPLVMPTEVRDFLRQDRLLVRVRAYSGLDAAQVRIRLLNRAGQELLRLPALAMVGGASQFDLPFARYPRGEYRLEVHASFGSVETTQLLMIRLTG